MRKREFNNRMSLRGAYLYATWQSQQNKIIGRDPRVGFSILLRMTHPTVILGQQCVTRVSGIIKWIFGASPWVTKEESPQVMGERKCPMMTFVLWILISSVSMTSTVRAECVPSPNCAEIGYTATSCTGDSLKCPFDTSKLFCIPCDSSYQYTCTGTGQKGKGTSCDGKYVECECNAGYDLVDGNCVISCA